MQEVSVQIGELLTRADLLQVVRGNNQEVAEGVECVKELQYQGDLEDRQVHCVINPTTYQSCHASLKSEITGLILPFSYCMADFIELHCLAATVLNAPWYMWALLARLCEHENSAFSANIKGSEEFTASFAYRSPQQ